MRTVCILKVNYIHVSFLLQYQHDTHFALAYMIHFITKGAVIKQRLLFKRLLYMSSLYMMLA